MDKINWSWKKISIILFFIFYGFILIHSFHSINNDIGRHLKLGEIIVNTHSIPDTNLFSYTEPDFKFANHHWLSEVFMYLIYSVSGFSGLIVFKIIILVTALLISYKAFKSRSYIISILSLVLSFLVLLDRTEMRPEVFSFLFLSIFLYTIFKTKYENKTRLLWALPILQILWTNSHIYFFIGPFLMLFFFIDKYINRGSQEIYRLTTVKNSFWATIAVFFATIINPHGIVGALTPFTILKNYGYSIVENQGTFFVSKLFGAYLPIYAFFVLVAVVVIGIIFALLKYKKYIFEIGISLFFIYAGFKMLRNLPLLAIGSIPLLAIFGIEIKNRLRQNTKWLLSSKKISIGILLISFVFSIGGIAMAVSDNLYQSIDSPKHFGFTVPNASQRAIDFIKESGLRGPIFNNFDIGGYLIWKLYPEEKVFVDNRPEAYSVEFFDKIYKPMQSSEESWKLNSEKFGINYVLFSIRDITPWAQDFFKNIGRDSNWPIVYLNEDIVIFAKRNIENKEIISKYELSDASAIQYLEDSLSRSNGELLDINISIAQFAYRIGWFSTSLHFAQNALNIDNSSGFAHKALGIAYATNGQKDSQQKAIDEIKLAIEKGFKNDPDVHFFLALLYFNVGDINSARNELQIVLKINPSDKNAKNLLEKSK